MNKLFNDKIQFEHTSMNINAELVQFYFGVETISQSKDMNMRM